LRSPEDTTTSVFRFPDLKLYSMVRAFRFTNNRCPYGTTKRKTDYLLSYYLGHPRASEYRLA
jgi:hypothetical protein